MTQQISKENISLAKRYDAVIADLQHVITVVREMLNTVENKNLVLGNKTNNFIANLEQVTTKAIAAFDIVTEERNVLYNLE